MRAALSSSGMNTSEESIGYKAERKHFKSWAGDLGDRRTEVVFIGTNLNKAAIESALNDCLLTDAELEGYRATWAQEDLRIAAKKGPFRFSVGTRVECNMGTGW